MTNDKHNFLMEYSKFLDSSGRHLTYSAISAFRNFGAELSEKERKFLENHLDECNSCSARLREVGEVEGSEPLQQPKMVVRMIPAIYRYSLAATIVIGVGLATAFYMMTRPTSPTDAPTGIRSLITQELDPERIAPNEMMENFVGRTLRSGSEVTFIAPNAGDSLAVPFTFRWDDHKRGRTYTLTVVDNKNVEVWNGTTSSREIEFSTNAEPGLYYAKLEADGALVRVKRFILISKLH